MGRQNSLRYFIVLTFLVSTNLCLFASWNISQTSESGFPCPTRDDNAENEKLSWLSHRPELAERWPAPRPLLPLALASGLSVLQNGNKTKVLELQLTCLVRTRRKFTNYGEIRKSRTKTAMNVALVCLGKEIAVQNPKTYPSLKFSLHYEVLQKNNQLSRLFSAASQLSQQYEEGKLLICEVNYISMNVTVTGVRCIFNYSNIFNSTIVAANLMQHSPVIYQEHKKRNLRRAKIARPVVGRKPEVLGETHNISKLQNVCFTFSNSFLVSEKRNLRASNKRLDNFEYMNPDLENFPKQACNDKLDLLINSKNDNIQNSNETCKTFDHFSLPPMDKTWHYPKLWNSVSKSGKSSKNPSQYLHKCVNLLQYYCHNSSYFLSLKETKDKEQNQPEDFCATFDIDTGQKCKNSTFSDPLQNYSLDLTKMDVMGNNNITSFPGLCTGSDLLDITRKTNSQQDYMSLVPCRQMLFHSFRDGFGQSENQTCLPHICLESDLLHSNVGSLQKAESNENFVPSEKQCHIFQQHCVVNATFVWPEIHQKMTAYKNDECTLKLFHAICLESELQSIDNSLMAVVSQEEENRIGTQYEKIGHDMCINTSLFYSSSTFLKQNKYSRNQRKQILSSYPSMCLAKRFTFTKTSTGHYINKITKNRKYAPDQCSVRRNELCRNISNHHRRNKNVPTPFQVEQYQKILVENTIDGGSHKQPPQCLCGQHTILKEIAVNPAPSGDPTVPTKMSGDDVTDASSGQMSWPLRVLVSCCSLLVLVWALYGAGESTRLSHWGLRPSLNKKLFLVHRPSGLKGADWNFFVHIFNNNKNCFTSTPPPPPPCTF